MGAAVVVVSGDGPKGAPTASAVAYDICTDELAHRGSADFARFTGTKGTSKRTLVNLRGDTRGIQYNFRGTAHVGPEETEFWCIIIARPTGFEVAQVMADVDI